MSDACTVDEVLARQASNIGAGTAHIALLYDHDAFAGTAEMPRYRFSRLAAAEHHGIIGINCGHDQFLLGGVAISRSARVMVSSKNRSVSGNRIARRLFHWFALACSQIVHLSGYPSMSGIRAQV